MTTTTPRISVLMPVYNAQRYLREAVQSVLRQTFTDFELICINDGSSDGSLDILESMQVYDARLRVISRPNTGICGALNDGLDAARAPYIARMDADDLCDPHRFACQVAYLDEHPDCVAVGTWVQRADPFGSPAGTEEPPTEHDAIDANLLRGNGGAMVHATLMMRRSVLRGVGGWDGRFDWVEDLDLFLRLAEAGRVANLPRHLYTYRRHPDSVCSTKNALMNVRLMQVLRAAYRRRGLGDPPAFSVLRPDLTAPPPTPAELHRNWACHALHHGNQAIARRHAVTALRQEPWTPRSWRVLYWSLAA